MNQPSPQPGDKLTAGELFRRVPNTDGRWDSVCGFPRIGAFVPGKDRATGKRETGISTYLKSKTSVPQVLEGHDPDFGVVTIDIAELHAAIAELRQQPGVPAFGAFSVTFDPSDDPTDGPAGHAHCYVEPMPEEIQKEMLRLVSQRRIVKPCGPLRRNTGSSTV